MTSLFSTFKYSDGLTVVGISFCTAVVCEAISWLLIYRTTSYKSLKSSIDKASKKLETMKTDSTVTAAPKKSKTKKIDRVETSLKESSRDLSLFKFKSGGVVALVLFVVFGFLNNLFEGKAVAKLPFVPARIVQKMSHRGLQGDDATDCSMAFLYFLCSISIRTNLQKFLGFAPPRGAAGAGDIELMEALLSTGVEVDSQSDAGTPLVWASGHGQQDALKLLLKHKADPNIETDDGITPLLSAVAAGSVPCLELLIQAGGKVNITAGGATPLHVAADIGNSELITCLLKSGADPNVIDEEGWKPVQVAALRGNRGAVEVLVPVSSHVESIPNWTVDGIIQYMQSEGSKNQEVEKNTRNGNLASDATASIKEIPVVTTEAKKKAGEAKSRADDAYRRKEYLMAVDAYTQAIDFDPSDGTLYSNRSMCWIRLGQADQALTDAQACRELKPNWAKAWYREGAALRLMQKFEEAANAFYEGVKLDPENKELVHAFREAVDAGRAFHGTKNDKEK